MMKLTRSVLGGLVFLAGCAVGGASSQLVVPKANAQNVQRWDYFCIDAEAKVEDVTRTVKKVGVEGWEMVGNVGPQSYAVCFKRPM